ncbi:endonuclease VII domain-containing protein [Arthrobacter sp. KK5.5]|uniref:endonuclease VII domain-containing protein n=1 Tax=Arthrobacter sp. KK5.5 TaxID=3373084 RepID=UPI003EE44618
MCPSASAAGRVRIGRPPIGSGWPNGYRPVPGYERVARAFSDQLGLRGSLLCLWPSLAATEASASPGETLCRHVRERQRPCRLAEVPTAPKEKRAGPNCRTLSVVSDQAPWGRYVGNGEKMAQLPGSAHGKTSRYRTGCRCKECRAAHSAATQAYRAQKRVTGGYAHATLTGYTMGCRCALCQAGGRAYRVKRAARHEKAGAYIHGTNSSYTSGCRCDLCKGAHREYLAQWRARKAAEGTHAHGTCSGYVSGCRCPDCRRAVREYVRARTYRLARGQFDAMLAAQGGLCAACGGPPAEKKSLNVDHDHGTGAVRALLCFGCNVSLGHLGEDPRRIEGLLGYALRWAGPASGAPTRVP